VAHTPVAYIVECNQTDERGHIRNQDMSPINGQETRPLSKVF
jgi:hypothetical protein